MERGIARKLDSSFSGLLEGRAIHTDIECCSCLLVDLFPNVTHLLSEAGITHPYKARSLEERRAWPSSSSASAWIP